MSKKSPEAGPSQTRAETAHSYYLLRDLKGKTQWPVDGIEVRDIDREGLKFSYTLLPGPGSKEVHPVPISGWRHVTDLHRECVVSDIHTFGYRFVDMEHTNMEELSHEEIDQLYRSAISNIQWNHDRTRPSLPGEWQPFDIDVFAEALERLKNCFDGKPINNFSKAEVAHRLQAVLKYFDEMHIKTKPFAVDIPEGRDEPFHRTPNSWEITANMLSARFPFLRTW
ncbi:hypothetical protein L0Y34_00620 [Candidatus Parcubacteria bacterium]|nr:hypothetical protein [Candidatus Parcubacteria bacterium]